MFGRTFKEWSVSQYIFFFENTYFCQKDLEKLKKSYLFFRSHFLKSSFDRKTDDITIFLNGNKWEHFGRLGP